MEMNLCLAKMVFQYDWEFINDAIDWEVACRSYIPGWWKAPLYVRFYCRQ